MLKTLLQDAAPVRFVSRDNASHSVRSDLLRVQTAAAIRATVERSDWRAS
jgi:hypothetical protein